MKRIVLTVIIICSSLFVMGQQKNLKLCSNGVSDYSIVIPTQATEQEIYAANLLQKDFKRITTCTLPIVSDSKKRQKNEISIGNTNRKNSKTQTISKGYRIQTIGTKLFIYQGTDCESYNPYVIYGVVDLLQLLGVRKYTPDCEVYPSLKSVSIVNMDTTYVSKNTFRQVNNQYTHNNIDFKYWLKQHVWEDMFAKGYFVHTVQKLIPRDTYFSTHPEYFSLVDEKRLSDQICWTNPEVQNVLNKNLAEQMALQPKDKVWSISQNDNFTYCKCDRCMSINDREDSPAGSLWLLVNHIADLYPDRQFSTLAYQFSRKPPLYMAPKKNVQVMLCTIEEDRNKPISDQLKDTVNRTFASDIKGWGEKTDNIFLWDYEVDFAYSISPFPNIHTLKKNLEFFMQNNAFQHFQQANSDTGHEFAELKMYLLSSLEWNINQDQDSIINQFLRAYYHAAAPFVREYIDKIENYAQLSGDFLDIYAPPTKYANTFLTAAKLKVYENTFLKAQKAVGGDTVALWRVKGCKLPVLYAIMEIGKADMFSSRGWYYEQGGKYILREDMKQRLEEFNTTCKHIGVKTMNESGLTPQEYYDATKRFIVINVEDNLAFRKQVTAQPKPESTYSNGDLQTLTNGVNGECEYKVHWLGWSGKDFTLTMDLDTLITGKTITLSSLYCPKSWILHPCSVKCMVSADGKVFSEVGSVYVGNIQKDESITKNYSFTPQNIKYRYVRFEVEATKHLPSWHASAGGESWVFIDEITVR